MRQENIRRLSGTGMAARLLLLGLLLSSLAPAPVLALMPATSAAAALADEAWLDEMMAEMSTADKVGQLFLVTFRGSDVSAESDVAHLVQFLRVGGVIISPENGNYVNSSVTASDVRALTTGLQELAFSTSLPVTLTHSAPVTVTLPITPTLEPTPSRFLTATTVVTVSEVVTQPAQNIPLLIAVSQEGNGYPHSHLRTGFTSLPSFMALGATWNDSNARVMGEIAGRELAAVGVNLLLGPSLDVLNDPRPGQSGDLGTRVLGGDPYWVGRLGQAYVQGVHLGSDGRVATVGKHLPGLGASDRSLEQEIATVDKSLQELQILDLPPFFAVTGSSVPTDTIGALMTAHIRYRGFQGNIRIVTKPISLNPQALQQILSQPELAAWREGGGVLVSDSLGVPAVRRHYSPELDAFPHRQIALDAFQAGNDILTLSRFSLSDTWEEQVRNIEDTILFFQSRYELDNNFRARVDLSVRRVLSLKRGLCQATAPAEEEDGAEAPSAGFSLEACIAGEMLPGRVGTGGSTVAQIAQQAVTLLYPRVDELPLGLTRPPRRDERVLIFTDVREARECELCAPFYLLDPELIREVILRMYGPDGSGQINPDRVVSRTFDDLQNLLTYGNPDMESLLREADWILFAMLDYDPDRYPSSAALKQFLREWTATRETQNVVVMAFGAPYYLDTTEVSKLAAYYGVYDKTQPFVEAAVRALFFEYAPTGRPPVTVKGVGYELASILAPDPDQQISVDRADEPAQGGTPGPIKLEEGDSLQVRTGVIVDHNGNPVPDGTPVTFQARYLPELLEMRYETTTVDGVAEVTITLEMAGEIEIRATSEPATSSRPLFVIMGETTVFLTPTPTETPSPTPTLTPSPTPTLTPSPTPRPSATPSPTPPAATAPVVPPEPRLRWVDLFLAVAGMSLAGGAVAAVTQALGLGTVARLALWSGVSGLVGYLFYGLGLPGSSVMEEVTPGLRGLILGFAWGLLPLGYVALLSWRERQAND
jgi:beta-N-acetylhexosaminidase